jgi:hypothetical protein
VNFVVCAPSPLPPFVYGQCDRGPQPSVGWHPRSGREIEWALKLGPIPLDAHLGQSNTEMGGIPTDSSVASSDRPYLVYRALSWVLGVLDGQAAGWQGRPQLRESCRQPQFHTPRDEDWDDGCGPAPCDWHPNINARGWPSDDLPRTGSHGARQRTRSPRGGGQRHEGDSGAAQDWRGRQMPRSPVGHRARQPYRRDDEGWERRRSPSPLARDHTTTEIPCLLRRPSKEPAPASAGQVDRVAARFPPEPFLAPATGFSVDDSRSVGFHSGREEDPMLLELVKAAIPVLPASSSPPEGEDPASNKGRTLLQTTWHHRSAYQSLLTGFRCLKRAGKCMSRLFGSNRMARRK